MTEAATTQRYPSLTKEIVWEILDSDAPYKDDEEREACRRLVEFLEPDELRTAACTSYAYWYAITFWEDEEKPSSDVVGVRMAMREARRHLVGSYHDEEVALTRLRECCQFRKEYHLELFRTCYPVNGEENPTMSEEDEAMKAKIRGYVEEELHSKQPFFVRGQDRESRAMAIKLGRTSPETTHEAYQTVQLYVAERAVSCTEFLSRGKQEKVVAIMDYEGYSSSNAPPILTLKDSLTLLQAHYPERLKTAIITEPAFWMRGIYNIVYPLMSTDTRDKVQMAYGEGKHETISAIVASEEAMPFMVPDAKLEEPFEVEKFLKEVPFYCKYDLD